ncbi:hypothetical protein LJC61_03340 [Ruminococcaceae bacterium OttesenSCG-928-A16]|nr:hypothetical protein [Ruminococcaceae bacterium OttesenSCG-928-A16]
MPATYIGITIGPIYDTIRLSSTPAALWAASYLYSHIAKRICEETVSQIKDGDKAAIITPYFCGNTAKMDEGVGLFHDRIIFETDRPSIDMGIIQNIFGLVKDEIAQLLNDQTGWIQSYLQFHAVAFESDDNPILDSSPYLDAIELAKSFPDKTANNPLAELFESADKNTRIRMQIKDGLHLSSWPLFSGEPQFQSRLPDMEYIVGKKSETKRCLQNREKLYEKPYSYYAIVQSDGDKFGEYIASHEPLEASRKCLDFCLAAAEMIQGYGGVTIYAGGDDLLFLAPLWEKPNEPDVGNRRNILEFLLEVKEKFCDVFGSDGPTISFGVAVRFYKYPLYEAFDEAYSLLFRKAKATRNSLALSLRKHSGQNAEFVLEQFDDSEISRILSGMIVKRKDGDFLQSTATKLWQFRPLFAQALSMNDNAVKNVFENIFDSEIHTKYQSELDEVRELLLCLNDQKTPEERLQELDALLRFVKFFSEKGREDDEGGLNEAEG